MLLLALAAGAGASESPQDGLRLLPVASRPVRTGGSTTPSPLADPVGLAALGAAAGAAALAGRRGLRVLFVAGYGSSGGGAEFAAMAARLGLQPNQVEIFDYRRAVAKADHGRASRVATVDQLVPALQDHLQSATVRGESVYLIAHSLGAVTAADMLADWDNRPELRNPELAGVVLLDPPMADGILGFLQSGPRVAGFPAHDGGYDPVRLVDGVKVDSRESLGQASGVPVVVLRNPKAAITNFWDRPAGLRIIDAPDPGPSAWSYLLPGPGWPARLVGFVLRAASAHSAVYSDPAVIECVRLELAEAGSCRTLPEAEW